ncbi:hypothetical protein TCE0_034f10040 [Talaromyces pinophilus]|jgi:hypothetical protein|uniref:Uncharacterized protein n=1 Tax=Talaromyces pinophilus TaxID=128442 RepID=A0A6V8HBU6_TALPI|nr:hypothetical protein TCE0_034f10040 [Talaromyces pinophilus]
MANTDTGRSVLSAEQYHNMFLEAQHLKMIPYDFRVWDRYLYSKCLRPYQAVLLRDVHVWLLKMEITPSTIGQWCVSGKFEKNAHEFIKNSNNKYGDSSKILEFLEKNAEVLGKSLSRDSAGDQRSVNNWLAQGRACVRSGKPSERDQDPNVKAQLNAEWIKKRNAYFAFGVIVWGAVPDPIWVLDDINLDTYYDLGYPIANTSYLQNELWFRYMTVYKDTTKGVAQHSFKDFYTSWKSGTLPDLFLLWGKAEPEFIRNLGTFFKQKANGQEPESIWRLSHLLYMGIEYYKPEAIVREGIVQQLFGKVWAEYRLEQGRPESIERIHERRKQYWKCLHHCVDPMELHRRMLKGDWESVRQFAREADEAHGQPIDSKRLALL